MRLPRTALICGLMLLTACSATIASAEIAWRTDLTTAHAEAKAQNKPLLLHFFSDNCIWCDRLEAGAFQSPEVSAALAQGFVPIKIHAGKSPEIAKMFKVSKFPTDVVVTPAGKTLAHGVSPQDPTRYIAMLAGAGRQMMPQASPVAPATQRLAQKVHSPQPSAGTGGAMTNPHVAQTAVASVGDTALPGGATTRLAGARTEGMTLGMPSQSMSPSEAMPMPEETAMDMATPPSNPEPPAAEESTIPKLAMEGYCAVTVIDEDRWAEGNPKFGVVHLGKLYLFESQNKMAMFLEDPTPYTPILNEIDVVRFFEERKIVRGKRQFGMKDPVHGRMFFFADEAAMNHFYNEYARYTDAAVEVMQQAVRDANPDAS